MNITSLRSRLPGAGREVGKPQSRPFLLITGAFGIFFALLLLYVGFNAANSIPGRSYYYINAEFEEADNITDTYQVRSGAELIGQVSDTSVHDGNAVVELQLAADQGPLLSDTTLRIRPRSPIGVRYIELTKGTEGTRLPQGATIPASQTKATVTIDGALSSLDKKTRAQTQIFLKEFGEGFADRGFDGNKTLAAAPEFLQDTDQVVGSVNALDGALARFISSSQGAANAADPVRDDIGQGFAPEADALKPFKEQEQGVQDTLEEAPPTLQTARVELARTDPLVTETGLLARNSRPMLQAAPGALNETSKLLDDSQPSLRNLNRTLDLVGDAVNPTLGLLDTVNPVLPNIEDGLKNTLPILNVLAPRGCDYDRMFNNWESMLGFTDGSMQMIRFEVIASEETIGGGKKGVTPTFSNAYPKPCQVGKEPIR
ncbi:MAG: phospholipid/cholesterol/gamma-HCH transport system substrate-binding protein [Thermoleophilaceae bacterium]|jgi:ABC-type transporter Mla subunit MlaD|nr:phospholipid/cholesterol/gamma-HCH transport system substrate-binding protein [Thermoleophilaceae bacterium]